MGPKPWETLTFIAFFTSTSIIRSEINAKSVGVTIVSDITAFIYVYTQITFGLESSIAKASI